MATIIKNLGPVTAYKYAVQKGYTGTEEEFAELMASYADVAEEAAESAAAAAASATAASGSASTASTKASEAAGSASAAAGSASAAGTKASEAAGSATAAAGSASTASTKADEAAASATAAAGSATTAGTKASEAASSASAAASSKTAAQAAQTAAEAAQTAAETAQGEAEDAAASVSESAAQIATNTADISQLKSDIVHKANIDGSYSSMTVGNAEQLVATVAVEDSVPYNFRTSGGTADIGDREVDKLVGGTVAWNQLHKIPANSMSKVESGVTIVDNRDGSFTVSTTAEGATANVYLSTMSILMLAGHKYLWQSTPRGGSASTYFSYIASTDHGRNDIGAGAIFYKNTTSNGYSVSIYVKAGTIITTPIKFVPQCFDLTQMFGSAIADYIDALEVATPGAGVAWFRKLFPKPYYAYNPGELMSVQAAAHKMVGFNAWDEEWEVGAYASNNGTKVASAGRIRSKNLIPVIPGATYYIKAPNSLQIYTYDASGNYINWLSGSKDVARTFGSDVCFITFNTAANSGETYNNDICINLSWDGERDGEYEPYAEHTYPLDDTLTLRGIPKLDSGNGLYYDGDTYESDGTVTRRYGVVDLGTLGNWVEYAGYPGLFYLNVEPSGAKIPKNNTTLPNLVVNGYIAAISRDIGTSGHTKGEIALAVNRIYVSNDTYSGDAAGFRSAISGVMLVYELAEPTTETADPFQSPQIVDDFGTEEYVDAAVAAETRDVAIPVGHNTTYQANLRAKLEMSPDSPDGDGDYIVRQTNGTNEYVPLMKELPTAPTTEGTYHLKATVASGGAVTLTWEADT